METVRVPRVHVAELPLELPASCQLDGDEAAHLIRVLRVRPGFEVELFDGRGQARLARVVAVERRSLELLVHAPGREDPALPFRLDAAVSPPKGKRDHRLIEALTELGVSGFAPLELERTESRAPREDEVRRWGLEAAKQCGRNSALEPLPPVDLAGLIAMARERELALVGDTLDAIPAATLLARPRPASVLLAVGPEGGFTPAERAALREAGFLAVRLGPTVLRIETAAEALAAACVLAWGDR